MEQDEIKAMNGLMELAKTVDIHDNEAVAKLDSLVTEAISINLVCSEVKLVIMLILITRHIEARE